jgi:hypothetical protein
MHGAAPRRQRARVAAGGCPTSRHAPLRPARRTPPHTATHRRAAPDGAAPRCPAARCPPPPAARGMPVPAVQRAGARRRGAVVVQANLFARITRVFKSYANQLGEALPRGSGHRVAPAAACTPPRRRAAPAAPSDARRPRRRAPRARAPAHAIPHPAVSAAEDPEKILDQVVTEMQEDLIKMRQASAQARGPGGGGEQGGRAPGWGGARGAGRAPRGEGAVGRRGVRGRVRGGRPAAALDRALTPLPPRPAPPPCFHR